MLFKLQTTEKSSAKATSLAFISFKLKDSRRNLINDKMPKQPWSSCITIDYASSSDGANKFQTM